MCWGVPGKIIKIENNMGTIDISGVQKDVPLDLITDPKVGEYVLVHAGYAVQKVDEEKAKFTIDFFKGKI
jgi:hydrogenase expression/formation protein HypC